MRLSWIFAVVGIAACAAGPTPRDLSNATLPTTRAYTISNMHAIGEVAPSPAVLDLLAAPDRTPADRALDEPRQAADLLTFLSVNHDMRVAELACGKGYLTELLARSVGAHGVVFGQNAPGMLVGSSAETAWRERLGRASDANVVRVDRDFIAPLPPEARGLDVVFLALPYGDLVPLGVDRDAMNHAVHLALRRGGRYVVLEETPQEGPLVTDLHALHTEESRNARREIESAGFSFGAEGRFLRDSGDPRDWDASPKAPLRGEKHNRFVLAFVKP